MVIIVNFYARYMCWLHGMKTCSFLRKTESDISLYDNIWMQVAEGDATAPGEPEGTCKSFLVTIVIIMSCMWFSLICSLPVVIENLWLAWMIFNNIADYIQLKDRGQAKGLKPRKQRTPHQRKLLQLHLQGQQHRVHRQQQNPNAIHRRGNERQLSKYQLQFSRQWGRRWEPYIQTKLIMNRWVSISRKQKANFS